MTTGSKQNEIPDSFVTKVLKGQQVLQIQLDDIQNRLNELQQQLRPLRDVLDQLRELNTMPMQLQQLLDMQAQVRKLVLLKESLVETTTLSQSPAAPPNESRISLSSGFSNSSRIQTPTTINPDEEEAIIPWPRAHTRGKSIRLTLALLRKRYVMDAIKHHILQYVTFTFDEENIHTEDNTRYSLFIYQRIAEVTSSFCREELQQGRDYKTYDNLPHNIQAQLRKQIELKVMENNIQIGKAEDHWIVNYFIFCYFRNRRAQEWNPTRQKKSKSVQKRRRKSTKNAIPSTSSTEATTHAPSSSPPSPPASVKRARTARLPVVISEDQDDDDYDYDIDN
ncbi:hypothetical protein BCR42DRAFT_448601 [Absidia repens]|uniref:Uncharacterized protein n=1 Tax=Absidia repens TaxID=90262 RepID=A0A1X2IPS1_9FUNG|nr:hypothetical protein BCR42DRAFT_448601 [Absidia repens]